MSASDSIRAQAGLGAHRFLMRAALAASGSFAWVFAFVLFTQLDGTAASAFARVLLLYALVQVITTLATPYFAARVRHGVRRLLIWGTVVLSIALTIWGAALTRYFGVSISIGVVGFAVALGLYRAMYWIPYAVEKERLAVHSVRNVPIELFIAFMPAIAGVSIGQDPLAPASLMFGMASVLLVSLLPLMHIKETYERYIWKYRQTFGELMEKRYRPFVVSGVLDGIQGASLLLIWPLAIFMLVGHSYAVLGLVLTATLLLSIPVRALGTRIHGSSSVHAAFAASSWVLRLIVATPVGIVLVDTYSSLALPRNQSLDRYALEQAADNGTYVDELTALKEISLAIGRLFLCVCAAAISTLISLPVGIMSAFLMAGLAAAYSIFLAKKADPATF
ncbi:hypothetical protein HY968_00365 [Candidatus Kaiserbacteria bacterium]|nr:hypothetical protein [Candidatus Kaiserbacteria bacterium]